MLYNIRVRLEISGSGQVHDRFLPATDEDNPPLAQYTLEQALGFVRMTAQRPEFRAVEVVPAAVVPAAG